MIKMSFMTWTSRISSAGEMIDPFDDKWTEETLEGVVEK